ncbi:hypothetical protein [Pseudonocardia sp. MH-G8]|uniref:hypothetical protein n=1 Tax=Pseudonocardia sp. MH-G8 TaxID=1854588 RepID=UPI000B9FE6FD|nr:hypothetical protein [Pseudonocardia sp. MH-G8]OZM76338.1 septum formation initiator [Pseudonocardia sp. MH-G8]
MSAPVTERSRTTTRSRSTTIPAQRGTSTDLRPTPTAEPAGGRRSAQQKAYARRDDRLRRIVGGRTARTAAPSGRPQYVLLIMVLLAVGLVATLWLSTAAAADSYRLEDATAEARALSEQAERLHREVAVLESAPELARRAAELGMTPVQDPARLVVAPGGEVEVVGEPRAAVAPPPPVVPAVPGAQPPAEGNDGAAPEGAAPEDAAPDATSGTDPLAAGASGAAAQGADAEATGPDTDAGDTDAGDTGAGDTGAASADGGGTDAG